MLGVGLLLSACSSSVHGPTSRPTAQLGTVAPAYEVGDELSPGIVVIDRIPTEKLGTSGTVEMDKDDVCRSVPGSVVTPAGFNPTPEHRTREICGWVTSGLALAVTNSPPVEMAETVTEHLDAANGRSPRALAHLAWLRIDGHYVIERIAKSDPASTCALTLDLGSATVVSVGVAAIDAAKDEPAPGSPEESKARFCPPARTVAQNLLHHLLDPLGPPGAGISTR